MARPERIPYLIVSEYNGSLQGFLVAGVDRIIRFSWSAIKTPPAIVRENNKGAVTAVTMLEDGRMVLILDVEKVLNDICPRSDDEVSCASMVASPLRIEIKMHVCSPMIHPWRRTQIRKALERLEMSYIMATTGGEAWSQAASSRRSGDGGRQRASGPDSVHSQRYRNAGNGWIHTSPSTFVPTRGWRTSLLCCTLR
jgi:two-component system chemotaxis response regulator CheV